VTPPFDPAKDRRNRERHGISLARFADMTEPIAIYSPQHGENRWLVLGWIDGQLYAGVATRRDGAWREISLRRASRAERKEYARAHDEPTPDRR
jgi:uncharacterized protein